MTATSINISGYDHGAQPIPAASRVGPLVMTGGVHGLDTATGAIPDNVEDQARLMFENLSKIMNQAGGSVADIVKVTVFVGAPEARAAVNAQWVKLFPDPAARPARHTLAYDSLPANILVQCSATAFVSRALGE